MIRDALAALGEAALMIAALVGICLLIIAPFLTWPAALWAVYRLDAWDAR